MKEKLSSVVERLEIIGQIVLALFVAAGIVLGFVGEEIGGFFKRNKIKLISAATVFVIFAGWVCGTGIVKVEPQTVRVVRVWEPGSEQAVAKPFINDSDKTKIYFTWPRIPGTDIGVKEEVYPLNEPIVVETEVELFPLAALTGNPKDADKVVCLVISGNIQVTDWKEFLTAFDPQAKPEYAGKSRMDLLKEEIQYDTKYAFILGFFDNHFADFASRVYFAHKFAQNYDLKSPAEVEEFLKTHRSWYWVLGPTYLKQFQEQIKRNVFPDSFTAEFASYCYLADEIEKAIQDADWELYYLAWQKEALSEVFDDAILGRAESVLSQFVSYLESRGEKLSLLEPQKQLSDFLIKNQIEGAVYSAQDYYVVRILVDFEAKRLKWLAFKEIYEETAAGLQSFFSQMIPYIDETEFDLWRAAIQESFKNKELRVDVLMVDFYNQWLKTPEGMEYFKKYYAGSLTFYLTERDLGIHMMDLSFEIKEKAPAK